MKTIYLGSDHGGFQLKEKIKTYLEKKEYKINDLGCNSEKSCDYPVFGLSVASQVVSDPNGVGIVICGSGIGISIASNKVKGARAALCNTIELAELARKHNDANILAIGGRTQFFDDIFEIINTFLNTEADISERHIRRRKLLDNS